MIPNTVLNIYEEHPYKHQLQYYGIKQYDLAKSIGLNQASLSRMLSGIQPMREVVEDEIQLILNEIKKKHKPKKKHKRITKKHYK